VAAATRVIPEKKEMRVKSRNQHRNERVATVQIQLSPPTSPHLWGHSVQVAEIARGWASIGVVVAIAVIFVLSGLKILNEYERSVGFSPGTPDTIPR